MNSILSFAAELLTRLFGKTPKFFKIVQILSIVVTLLSGLPAYLQESGVILPEYLNAIASKVVAVCGIVATVIAQLTVTTQDKEAKGLKD